LPEEAAICDGDGFPAGDGFTIKRFADVQSVKPPLGNVSAFDISTMEFKDVKYVVPGYIAEGATLLAGKPKLGKSWLCLDIALAVASGGMCLGNIACDQGDVLYLALEDNQRRLHRRLMKLWSYENLCGDNPMPNNLYIDTECPRANEGGVEAIRDWLDRHPTARLVIVDVLAMFRATAKGKEQTQYDADYLAIKALQALAMEKGVAIVIVHHTRKGAEDNDPFEKVSGTLGLSGAADAVLILDRDANGCTLYGRGRDIEEIETAIQFDRATCRWSALGNASEVHRSSERSAILQSLKEATEPLTPANIATEAQMKRHNVENLLSKMVRAGEVVKAKRGRYVHPSRPDLLTDPSTV
jgi:hypothetical protein